METRQKMTYFVLGKQKSSRHDAIAYAKSQIKFCETRIQLLTKVIAFLEKQK